MENEEAAFGWIPPASKPQGSNINTEQKSLVESLGAQILCLKRDFDTLKSETKKNLESRSFELKSHLEGKLKSIVNDHDLIKAERDALLMENEKVLTLLDKSRQEQKQLLEENICLKGNIRVYTRVRPSLQNKEEKNYVSVFDATQLVARGKTYAFDCVFGPGASQDDVFREVSPLVHSCTNGYNACIFAYGQTGSGKTYTMEGTAENPGVNYLALHELFKIVKERSASHKYEVKVSILECYNDEIRDLLGSNSSKLVIREKRSHDGNHIPGLISKVVTNTGEVSDVMKDALSNRITSVTDMNIHSSRSHCITMINVTSIDLKSHTTSNGSLVLIDLAGSERVDRSGAQGHVLTEAKHINKSLSALGNVIEKLQQKDATHVPYRDSKLTLLLKEYLSGQSKVLMICQISPERHDLNESVTSLLFAERTRRVELGEAKKSTQSTELIRIQRESMKAKEQITFLQKKLNERVRDNRRSLDNSMISLPTRRLPTRRQTSVSTASSSFSREMPRQLDRGCRTAPQSEKKCMDTHSRRPSKSPRSAQGRFGYTHCARVPVRYSWKKRNLGSSLTPISEKVSKRTRLSRVPTPNTHSSFSASFTASASFSSQPQSNPRRRGKHSSFGTPSTQNGNSSFSYVVSGRRTAGRVVKSTGLRTRTLSRTISLPKTGLRTGTAEDRKRRILNLPPLPASVARRIKQNKENVVTNNPGRVPTERANEPLTSHKPSHRSGSRKPSQRFGSARKPLQPLRQFGSTKPSRVLKRPFR